MIKQSMRCELMTWQHFLKLARQLAYQVRDSGYQPDLIIAIARGGLMPARLLSDYLDITDLASFRIVHYRGAEQVPQAKVMQALNVDVTGKRVLLVDDVSDSGDTFELALPHIYQKGQPAELRSAVLDHKTVSRYEPDYYPRTISEWHWIIYPWAVIEDCISFIRFYDDPGLSEEQLVQRIETDFAVNLELQTVRDALAAIKQNG